MIQTSRLKKKSTSKNMIPSALKRIERGKVRKEKPWFVYILECMDESLYTGVTNDIENRIHAHATGKGSKYVKRKGFNRLLRAKECKYKSDACKYEYQIKQLSRNEKLDWFI